MTDAFPLTTIQDGDLRAVFAPTLGGRMLSLRLGHEELLWQNPALIDADLRPAVPVVEWPRADGGMGTWANVGGSKTWPAPQGWSSEDEWAGPPDRVLDAGSWDVTESGPNFVSLRSARDPRTGLQIERAFEITSGAVLHERIRMTNVSRRDTRWAPWEVCQVRTNDGGTVYVAGAAAADEVDLGSWEGAVPDATPDAGGLSLPVGRGVAKRGYRAGTHVAYRRASGTTVALSAADEPDTDAPYPDGGCRFELWLQRPVSEPIAQLEGLRPDAHLVELEVLGRRTPLAPGELREMHVHWTVTRADAGSSDRSSSCWEHV